MELKVGDVYKCPEDYKAKIVWISEDKKTVGVQCSHEHFHKLKKVADYTKHVTKYRNNVTKEEKIYAKDMVFLIKMIES